MKWTEKRTLASRGPVESLPSAEITGLQVGPDVAHWEEHTNSAGMDICHLSLALKDGKKAFLIRKARHCWAPYTADGDTEFVLSLNEGVDRLLKVDTEAVDFTTECQRHYPYIYLWWIDWKEVKEWTGRDDLPERSIPSRER